MNAARHYEAWELLAFIDESGEVDRESVALHLEECADCRSEADSLRSFWSRVSDPAVYAAAAAAEPQPDASLVSSAEAFVAIREVEDEIARDLVERLRDRPASEWGNVIATLPEQRTESLVHHLLGEARESYERDPARSLAILGTARTVADTLTDMFALARQRAAVAKERANVFRILGRNTEALEELDWAERFLRHLPMHDFELAFVEWTRATVFLHMTRYEEGLASARQAARILREYGEAARAEQVRVIEAGILYEQGQVDRAIEMYERLSRVFAALDDKLTLARIEANLAECRMRRAEWVAVREHAARAIALFASFGNETEQARVRWTLAHAMLEQGRLDEGLDALHDVAAAFNRLDMKGEAAGVMLDLVELHLKKQQWSEAIDFAARAAAQFTVVDAPLHIAEAYAYLRDAVTARAATLDLVHYVRDYVSMSNDPPSFQPPASGLQPN